MGVIEETQKRLEIARDISSQLEGIVRAVYLGGSMGYGQNYSVTEESDIDMVIVTDLNEIGGLSNTNYFRGQIDNEVMDLFRQKGVNFFWVTREVEGVQVNTFIYETRAFEDFCLLQGELTGYIPTKPRETQTSYGFEGKEITFGRNVRPFSRGWLYDRRAIIDGSFALMPPAYDFFENVFLLYEENNFVRDLEKQIWKKVTQQLLKEYGPEVNLDRFNILNSHYINQARPEKIPPGFEDKIRRRTFEELLKLKGETRQ